jgi:16S rRNA (cytosine967-C5)-methyltransferase
MERNSNKSAPAAKEGQTTLSDDRSALLRGPVMRTAIDILDAAQRAATAQGWLKAADLIALRLREARSLHSGERRAVADALHQIVRGLRRLRALCGEARAPAAQLYAAHLFDMAGPLDDLPMPLRRAVEAAGLDPEAVQARRARFEGPLSIDELGEALSYPDWVVKALVADLGAAEAEAVLRAQNQRAPLTVRVNLLKGDRAALRERLRAEGVESEETALSPYGLRLRTRVNVYGLPSFQQGWMEVQDEGSQLIAELVAPPPGGLVVDACAGAGGKTLALASLMANKGRLLALDIDEHRLRELQRRARRAGLTNVQARAVAAQQVGPDLLPRGAARVLVDAPCSGLGVLRRNPEARWRLSPQDIADLSRRQGEILRACAGLVAPHGRLIYATCTILRKENDEVIEAFLREHPEFQSVPAKEILGAARATAIGDGQNLRLLPRSEDGPDGFFAAVMRRTA